MTDTPVSAGAQNPAYRPTAFFFTKNNLNTLLAKKTLKKYLPV